MESAAVSKNLDPGKIFPGSEALTNQLGRLSVMIELNGWVRLVSRAAKRIFVEDIL